MTQLSPTPSHTVGPFYGYALPFPGGGDLAPAGHPDTITVHGRVHDGEGAPRPGRPGRAVAGGPGRLAVRRARIDAAPTRGTGDSPGATASTSTFSAASPPTPTAHWSARTLRPGAPAAPYISVCVHARGLLHHLYTRLYFPENARLNAADPLLAALDPARRETLVATAEPQPGTYRFDIRLQGEGETVFLEFR
ncbi:protocatechuate 3,4-dioxygenase, alpha subunit [Streptomyces himastatinicus ATCC 53653]|uniref:Protocatechuate 3,4-dioxygenase, alpha subunit n=1 Tax=Streptomyces himastatinicus ATCC 53653 TaxID=457427 RepID=D9WT39_9ACTN|nr:protocatechuate 3,4-dioxygenase, alpha subunit [Streptomyces himastatinicus ATCC 53653]